MDFSLILLVFVVFTGLVSLWHRLTVERPARTAAERPARTAAERPAAERAVAAERADTADTQSRASAMTHVQPLPTKPLLVEYARALFPVVLVVFLLRSFVIEPFRIPSGSMLPSLHIGDFILVNKFSYGIRLPIINRKIIAVGGPERGDVMVFRYPRDPKLNFVKRVVGLPGDVIGYQDKQLFVNGEQVSRVADGEFHFRQLALRGQSADRYLETIDDATHAIIIDRDLGGRDMRVSVPPGNYFVMGDNRDHSNDSRYWRFVPEDHVVGRAFFIWFSWKGLSEGGVQWSRIGNAIR